MSFRIFLIAKSCALPPQFQNKSSLKQKTLCATHVGRIFGFKWYFSIGPNWMQTCHPLWEIDQRVTGASTVKLWAINKIMPKLITIWFFKVGSDCFLYILNLRFALKVRICFCLWHIPNEDTFWLSCIIIKINGQSESIPWASNSWERLQGHFNLQEQPGWAHQ